MLNWTFDILTSMPLLTELGGTREAIINYEHGAPGGAFLAGIHSTESSEEPKNTRQRDQLQQLLGQKKRK